MVFEEIQPHLEKDEVVTISFEGVSTANFPIFTAFVGNAYMAFGERAKELLRFDGITRPEWQEELDEAVYFASNPEKANIWNSSTEASAVY